MITKFKIFESAEERTSEAFTKWYKKLFPINYIFTEDDDYFFQQRLKAWLLYKPYFEDKNILNYKTYEDYEAALEIAKNKYYSKLKNVKEGVDYETIYTDDKVKILVPLTINGSCKYGYNTKWCTAMLEAPHNFERYKRDGELYRFIFNDDTKFSLHWANNGHKSFRNQIDEELEYNKNREYDSFTLVDAPFELSDDAKIAVSIDYMTKKWDYYYPKTWRKTKRFNNIEDYKKYLKFRVYDHEF